MKNLLYFLLFAATLSSTPCYSGEIKRVSANTAVNAVTVYADRAMTSRSTNLQVKPGSYIIAFDGLSTLIMDDSVRISGRGTASSVITGIETKKTFLEKNSEKRVQELQDEIQALEQRSAGLDAKRTGLLAQKSFLESIRVAWGERISKELAIGRPTASELQDASGFIGSGVTRVEEQNRDIEHEKRSVKDRIDALKRKQSEVTGSARKESKTVEVSVEVTRDGSLTLEMLSMTPQASWEPAYDVRLAEDGKSAALTFQAMIRQQTGEDWKNVDLSLSTAQLAVGGTPPELYPWSISLYHPQTRMAEKVYATMAAPAPMFKKSRSADTNDEIIFEERSEEPAQFLTSRVSEEQSSVSFHVPKTLDIPSDGSRHGSVVSIEQFPVSLEYLAIPKLSQTAFLKSELINSAAYPLLPGKVNTFVGNSFTGSSQLKKVAAGEKFELFFGSDDQVTVKRDELKQRKEAGLFGKNRVSYQYRIQTANFRKSPIMFTVQDQLPVAGDEEIKVTLDEPSIKPADIKSNGTIVWKTPLLAGEKKELTFGITVEYPKEKVINGL